MRQVLLVGAVIAAFLGATPDTVRAGDGFGYGYGPGLWAWSYASAYGRMPYRVGNLPTPPYFALHPPVYYSGIVHRPYGDSPFAYGPHRPPTKIIIQQVSQPAPAQVIDNPYFGVEEPTPDELPAPMARMIINPFYDGPSESLVHATADSAAN